MDIHILTKMVCTLIGGLGIFLFGMKNMSDGIQVVAGKRMRALINAVSNNRVIATGVGLLVTAIIQSSSITTVMVVGLVNASVMSLQQALGIIMGAEIGTTITGWILTLKVGKFGLPVLGISVFFLLFSKSERVKFGALSLMGLGMVFYGLQLMKTGFAPLKDMPEFVELLAKFRPDSYWGVIKCCFVGALVTAIIQSSSATVGITMGLVSSGVISLATAVGLVLGQNIGTTITAYLASLAASNNAKRAAFGHIFFNFTGVLWITAIFPFYVRFISGLVGISPEAAFTVSANSPVMLRGVALAHTVFNVANVVVFLPFLGVFSAALVKLFPEKEKDLPPKPKFLDPRMLVSPAIGIQQSFEEILGMGRDAEKMLSMVEEYASKGSTDKVLAQKIQDAENRMDLMQKEITEFLSTMLASNLPSDIVDKAYRQIRMADEYETVADYVMRIMKLFRKLNKKELVMSEEGRQDIINLHTHVALYVRLVNIAVSKKDENILFEARLKGDEVLRLMKECRKKHLVRVGTQKISPLKSLIYTDMLNDYRRIRDHMLNVAEALVGEK